MTTTRQRALWLLGTVGLAVNLNTATFPQLMLLPGISPKCAASLHDYRRLNGGWTEYRDLDRFRCLTGPMRLHVKFKGSTLIDNVPQD